MRLENLTLWQRVHDHLRAEILANRMLPGQELTEQALSAELGVSRAPVREALGRLAEEGLVTIRPRRGAVVASLTAEEFIEAYQMRQALEGLGVRLAVPRFGPEDIAAFKRLVAEQSDAVDADDLDAFFESNARFHERIVSSSGNGTLIETYERLIARISRYRMRSLELRGSARRSVAEHGALVRAMERGDVERAEKILVEHIQVPLRSLEIEGDDGLVLAAAVPA